MHHFNPDSDGSKLIQTGLIWIQPFFVVIMVHLIYLIWPEKNDRASKFLTKTFYLNKMLHKHFELPWNTVHFSCGLCTVAQIESAKRIMNFLTAIFIWFQSVLCPTLTEPTDMFSNFSCAMKAMCLAACLIEQTINLLNNYINIYSNNNDDFSTELVTFYYILCYFVNCAILLEMVLMSIITCCPPAEQKMVQQIFFFFVLACFVYSHKKHMSVPNDDVRIMKVSPQGHLLHLFPCKFSAILLCVNVPKPSRCLV